MLLDEQGSIPAKYRMVTQIVEVSIQYFMYGMLCTNQQYLLCSDCLSTCHLPGLAGVEAAANNMSTVAADMEATDTARYSTNLEIPIYDFCH